MNQFGKLEDATVIMEREDPTRSRGFGSSPLVPLALCALFAVCGGAEMKWSSVVGW